MTTTKLTISLPNYNHSKYIRMALDAILGQPFDDYEIIIIDDGSTDNSVEVIEEYVEKSSKIRFYRNECNRGVNYTLERILGLSTGEFIFFHSADDFVLPGFFEKSIDLLTRYPQAGLCCSQPAETSEDSGVIKENVFRYIKEPIYLSPDNLKSLVDRYGFNIFGHTSVIRREDVMQAGKMRSELGCNSDWFVYHVIGFRKGICYIPEALSVLRISGGSFSAALMKDRKHQKKVYENMLCLLNSKDYVDVRRHFIDSGILAVFGCDILRQMLNKREFWSFLSFAFVSKCMLVDFRKCLSRLLPMAWKQVIKRQILGET